MNRSKFDAAPILALVVLADDNNLVPQLARPSLHTLLQDIYRNRSCCSFRHQQIEGCRLAAWTPTVNSGSAVRFLGII
ncbi:hypothetical protein C1D09_000005 [Mesorhizobium intechi]|nr:hypothetical protein C1D09_000005 [Mesorhizobium intechi]